MNALQHNPSHEASLPGARAARRGVTLVELLVVVTILMMLAAFAIPTMRPLTEGRRIREAVRAIDVFITQAKIRAVANQRPVGIRFERLRQTDPSGASVYQDDACNVLRIVEIPPPYAGEFSNSRVRVQYLGLDVNFNHVLKVQIPFNDFTNGLLREGDRIQLNYRGPVFTIVRDANPFTDPSTGAQAVDFELDPLTGYFVFIKPTDVNYAADKLPPPPAPSPDGWVDSHVLTVKTPSSQLGTLPWQAGAWSLGMPYQIHRQPQASSVPPLRLPKNTVIDLGDSGYYIGLPDPNTSTPEPEGSDHYPAPNVGVRYAFQSYQQSSGENKRFDDAFARIGDSGSPDADNEGPMILFAPNGAIQSVYHWKEDLLPTIAPNYAPYPVTRPVFLMVGKWERTGHETISPGSPVRSLAEDGLHNWQDASNIWMAINPQNGMVTSAEVNTTDNAGNDFVTSAGVAVPGDPNDPDPGNLGLQMQISRAYAREAQISKGALEE